MLSKEEIKNAINSDLTDTRKAQARKGQNYYEGNHDISRYRFFYIDKAGDVVEDKNRTNVHISHPFFAELVDQCTQYMLSGKEAFVKSDIVELQSILDEYFNNSDNFKAELSNLLTDVQVKGSGYMYCYRDENDKLSFQTADMLNVIEIREDEVSENPDYVIYSYTQRLSKYKNPIKKIEVWDKDNIYFYVMIDDEIKVDEDKKINPRPHVVWDEGEDRYGEGLGFIPFFRMDMNQKRDSLLNPIKSLIDDYDLMECGLTNNIQDFSEAYYVVSGFMGDNIDELVQNLKSKRAIGVDEHGGISIQTVSIPYSARQVKLLEDEKNIYRFGMGFNSSQLGDGNITNVVIKSRYALLDLKANKLEIKLKRFLRNLVNIVLDDINKNRTTNYESNQVYFDFKRQIITNESDNASIELIKAQKKQVSIGTLLSLMDNLGLELINKQICTVLDLDYEEIKDQLPKEENLEDLLNDEIAENSD